MKRALLLLFVTLLTDCATLDALPESTCGNGVVDANEDCDSFPASCGAPTSGATACRLVCGKAGETCPAGWGCSVDGICRQPTGSFDPAAEPVSAGVTTMLVGDFDGDGRKDVLGSSGPQSKGRIHYFKDNAAPDVIPLPGVLGAPFVFDFDGDGLSDIAFGYTVRGTNQVDDGSLEVSSNGGFAIIQGQSDRAVVAKLFPTLNEPEFDALLIPLSLTKAANVPAAAVANPVMAYATGALLPPPSTQIVTGLRSVDGEVKDPSKGGYFEQIPLSDADQLASTPIATNMFDLLGDVSTCGEIVVPLTTRLLVYEPCHKLVKVSWVNRDPQTFTIPGETITRVFSVDLDNNGHADLIVGTVASDGPHVHVGFSDGLTLSFNRPTPDTLVDVPLASGFIDSDDEIDFVVPDGVLLSTNLLPSAARDGGADSGGGGVIADGILSWTLLPAPTKKWTVAAVADVNRDGILDVIGASQYETDIDVLEGTRSLIMPPFSVQTNGTVTNLAVSDYDFDFTSDIAFVQVPAGSSQREVAISYGRPLAMPPEALRAVGRLDGIRQVFPGPGGLGIASVSGPAGAVPNLSFAQLVSSADRQPVAPLFFPNTDDANTRHELTTRALVASANGTSTDLIGIVSDQAYRVLNGAPMGDPAFTLRAAVGTGPEAFTAPVQAAVLNTFPVVDSATGQLLVQTAVADLDGDGKGEVIAVAPNASATGVFVTVIRGGGGTSANPVQIAGKLPVGGERAQMLDVDGDGKIDLVTILADAATKNPTVTVLFGDGEGSFEASPLSLILPGAMDAPLDFTLLTTGGAAPLGGGAPRNELVVVTSTHLYRALIGGDRTAQVADATPLFGTIVSASAVASGDFDGDGVNDLAIADQGAIRIARQQPRLR